MFRSYHLITYVFVLKHNVGCRGCKFALHLDNLWKPTWTSISTNEPHCLAYLTNHTLFSANDGGGSRLWSTGLVLQRVC